jgi:hypothetical protein
MPVVNNYPTVHILSVKPTYGDLLFKICPENSEKIFMKAGTLSYISCICLFF